MNGRNSTAVSRQRLRGAPQQEASGHSDSAGVLICSAGRRVSLVRLFKQALRALGLDGYVIAAEMSPLSAAWHVADERYLVPPCTTPEYVNVLLDICREHSVALVVPTIDTELTILASHREEFLDAGVRVCVSAPETVNICSDKRLTNRWLRENGFPTVLQDSSAGVLAAPAAWTYPLIAKPRFGSASFGVHKIYEPEQLRRLHGDYVIQEIAAGAEHTVDVLVDRNGVPQCAVPRRRIEVRAGEISKGVTVHSDAIERLAMAICARLPGAYGVLNIQMFVDPRTSSITVIEINARFGGGFPLSAHAGADYPRWLLQDALNRPVTADLTWRDGVFMLRYDAEVFVETDPAAAAS